MHIEVKAHNLVNLEKGELERALQKDFNLLINLQEKIIHGYSSQVYRAILADKIVYVRINKKAEKFEAEILGYELFKKLGIPTPELIAYQRSPTTIGQPTIIISAAEGQALGDVHLSPEDKIVVYKKIGQMMRKIHSIKLPGFGDLKTSGGELQGQFSTWRAYWESTKRHNQKSVDYLLVKNLITREEAKVIKRVHDEIGQSNVGVASLLHKDISQSHVFIKGTDISGVIDFGGIIAGDPRLDIAMSLAFQKTFVSEAFKEGYGAPANDPLVLKYLIVIVTDKAAFRHKLALNDGSERVLKILHDTIPQVA